MGRLDRLREQVDLTRAQLGDGEAFTRLVERYDGRLRRYVRRLGAEESAAEDVLQEVWLSAYRTLRRVHDAEALPAWMYSIARHKALNWMRRQGRQPDALQVSDEVLEAVPDAGEPPDLTADEAEAVRRCLGKISVPHRDVLLLRFFEEMPYEQVAAVMGCSVGTVRSRLHYAKRALRRAMETEGTR
ncbi:MAG: sigma-70 family RNA polymerase sigma factor [Armatimonadetes bacterium]|nr:sigma-70 family RNA polymerase sigma factor [Armatimonadota bacterium]